MAEAVTNRQPPDQTSEILARLSAAPARATRRRLPRIVRYPLELAAAAALVVAIGFVTGLIRLPGSDTPEFVDPDLTWLAGPGSAVTVTDAGLQLERGYVLVKTGAPDVRRGESLFTQLEGMAVVLAGEVPTADEQSAIRTWLEERKVEETMIRKATQWAAGAAICVLMLQGTAQLDGQEVKAEQQPAPSPVWHKVLTAMELDRLPKDARYVQMVGLPGGYLPLIADYMHIEGIVFHGYNLLPSHIEALSALPKLRVLDLRGCGWEEGPDYTVLSSLKALTDLGLDLDGDDEVESQARKLAASGMKLRLGLHGDLWELFKQLQQTFPDTEDIRMPGASDAACIEMIGFKNLRRLTLLECSASELGYAHLSRLQRLEYLHLEIDDGSGTTSLPTIHHVSKIKALQHLVLDGEGDVEAGALSALGTMTQLRHLSLPWSFWEQLARLDGRAETPFKNMKMLETFEISIPPKASKSELAAPSIRHPLDVGALVGARKVVLHLWDTERLDKPLTKTVEGSDAATAARVEQLVINIVRISPPTPNTAENWHAGIVRYPNLKRVEIGRTANPPQRPIFLEYDERPTGPWHGGQLVGELRNRIEGIEIVDTFTR